MKCGICGFCSAVGNSPYQTKEELNERLPQDGFGKALAPTTKEADDLGHKGSSSIPPKLSGGVSPYSIILYIIVFLLLLKMTLL